MRKTILSLFTILLLLSPLAHAAVETFDGRGEYITEREEPTKHGMDVALQEAMRSVSQQAAVKIKNHSAIKDNELTSDITEMVTASVMQIIERKFDQDFTSDGNIMVIAIVRASIDVDKAEKMALDLIDAKSNERDYEKIKAEYAVAESAYADLKRNYQKNLLRSAKVKTREGIKLEREGKITEAMALYEEAIAADPNYSRAYSRRGHIYRQQGNIELAVKDYDKAASLDSKEAGWHYGRAIMLESAGNKAGAAKEYRQFIEYSDILEYDLEIPVVLNKILELEAQ